MLGWLFRGSQWNNVNSLPCLEAEIFPMGKGLKINFVFQEGKFSDPPPQLFLMHICFKTHKKPAVSTTNCMLYITIDK